MAYQIEYLADYPQHLLTVADWQQGAFGYLDPGVTLEDRLIKLRRHQGLRQIPTTLVAVAGDDVWGCASLIDFDMDTRMQLTPWLASVYVAPDQRRRGIGSALVRRIMEETRALGAPSLYLYTPDQERFYARLGWTVLERLEYRGVHVVVMTCEL